MDEFDKEFDNSPDAFDDAFEAAQPEPTGLEKLQANAEEFVNKPSPLGPSLKETAQTIQDFSKGAAAGLTMNSADELGGGIGAALETGLSYIPGTEAYKSKQIDEQLKQQGFSVPEESFLQKYRGYQQASEKSFQEAADRSPIAEALGQITGGVTSGVALGGALGLGGKAGKLKSITDIAKDEGKFKAAMELLKRGGTGYAKAAPAIALEAGLTSKEQLLGPEARPEELGKDVLGGLAFGLPAALGMQGIQDVVVPAATEKAGRISSKLGEVLEESPLARQTKIAFKKYGQELGVSPRSEKAILEGVSQLEGGTPFSQINTKRATDISNKVLKADAELGKLVGNSLDEATARGAKVDAQDIMSSLFDDIKNAAEEMPGLVEDKNFNAAMQKILKRNYIKASPREIKAAIDDISTTIDRIGGMKYPGPELEQAPLLLKRIRNELDQRLKDTVPEYRDAAERFYNFRRAYLEQPIAGGKNPEIEEIMYGDLRKKQSKLINAYEDLVARTTADSQSNEATEAAFSKLREATKGFEQQELARLKEGKIKSQVMPGADQFTQEIKNMADDAAVRRMTRKTQESQGGIPTGVKDITGIAQTGRGAILTGAYLAGKASKAAPAQKVAKMGRAIYNAPAETLNGLATKLEQNPALKLFGQALRQGLENGDSAKRNAALFTIMQNPNARAVWEAEENEEMDNELP